MNDFNQFLNWYLGERTRIARGLFNVIFFVAFIPVLFIKMNAGMEFASKKANDYKPLMDMAETMMNGGTDFDAYDTRGVMNKSQETRDITRQLMRDFGVGMPEKSSLSRKKGINWGEILNLIMFVALVPIVHMRLRDLGKWNTEMWVYTGLVYSGIAFDSLKSLMGIELPMLFTVSGGILTFVLLSWLCMAKTKKIKRKIGTDNTHMPGDRPDDPY